MTRPEDWKRASGEKPERKWVIPKVADDIEEDFHDWAQDYDEEELPFLDLLEEERPVRSFVSSVLGLFLLISTYALVLMLASHTVGVEWMSFQKCVILSSCFVFVRHTDAVLINGVVKNRR